MIMSVVDSAVDVNIVIPLFCVLGVLLISVN